MTRVKKGVHALKRRRSVLKQTKGMRHGRSTKERQAKELLDTLTDLSNKVKQIKGE